VKTKIFFIALFIFYRAYEEDADTLRYRKGLFLDYDGYAIGDAGFKYRVAPNWTPI
jgi:hypothetical protein